MLDPWRHTGDNPITQTDNLRAEMFLMVTQGGHPRWSGTLRLRSATYLGDHLTTDHLF